MMDFTLVNVNESSKSNYKTSKEERFNVINSIDVQFNERSLISYAQILDSGSQAITASTRTQLTIDGLGTGNYSTGTFWSSVDNKINLQDAVVGDYIDCQVFLPVTGVGATISVLVELDFSSALDGSELVTFPIANTSQNAGNYEYNVKFYVTQTMKDNGIGIMVTPTVNITVTGAKLALKVLPSQID